MKFSNKIGLIMLITIILSVYVTAIDLVEEDLDLDYTNVVLSDSEAVDAFVFTSSGDLALAGTDVVEVIVSLEGTQPGLYYKDDINLDYQFLSFPDYANFENLMINNADFAIYKYNNLRDLGVDEAMVAGLTSGTIDLDNSQVFVVAYRGTRPDVLKTSDAKGWLLFLLKDGNMLFLDEGSGLPLTSNQADGSLHYYIMPQKLKVSSSLTGQQIQEMALEQKEQAQQQATENAMVNVDAWDSSEDCVDVDDSDLDLQASFLTPSYAYTDDGVVISDRCQYDLVNEIEVLSEATCTPDGELLSVETVCANGCHKGKCGQDVPVEFCLDTDSNDAILDTSKEDFKASLINKGATAGFYASKDGSVKDFGIWDDYCSDEQKLVEYFCKDNKARFANINCYGGCDDAVCTLPLCFDSDGGNYENVPGLIKGVTKSGSYELKDSCNGNQLTEYYCDGTQLNGYNSLIVDCSSCVLIGGKAMCEGDSSSQVRVCEGDRDCESGEVCNSVLKVCEPQQAQNTEEIAETCTSDLGCRVTTQCSSSKCESEVEIDLRVVDGAWEQIIEMLQRRIDRLDAYEGVISQIEEEYGIVPDSQYGVEDNNADSSNSGTDSSSSPEETTQTMTLLTYDKNIVPLKTLNVQLISVQGNTLKLKIGNKNYNLNNQLGAELSTPDLKIKVKRIYESGSQHQGVGLQIKYASGGHALYLVKQSTTSVQNILHLTQLSTGQIKSKRLTDVKLKSDGWYAKIGDYANEKYLKIGNLEENSQDFLLSGVKYSSQKQVMIQPNSNPYLKKGTGFTILLEGVKLEYISDGKFKYKPMGRIQSLSKESTRSELFNVGSSKLKVKRIDSVKVNDQSTFKFIVDVTKTVDSSNSGTDSSIMPKISKVNLRLNL